MWLGDANGNDQRRSIEDCVTDVSGVPHWDQWGIDLKGARVVVTGVGLTSPIGNTLEAVSVALREGKHGISTQRQWAAYGNLATRLAAPVVAIDFSSYPRKKIRTMGRVALLAAYASDAAVADAGLTPGELSSGKVGLAYGSTHGSSSELEEFCRSLFKQDLLQLKASARNVAVELAIDPSLRKAVGDYDELTIVFQNLIDNALKYAKPATTVRVTARPVGDDQVSVAVSDEGDGIPAAHLPRLTERF